MQKVISLTAQIKTNVTVNLLVGFYMQVVISLTVQVWASVLMGINIQVVTTLAAQVRASVTKLIGKC